MDIGWATIIVAGIISLTVAMIKFVPHKDNPGHNPGANALNNKYVRKDLCDERHEYIEKSLEKIEKLLERRRK